MADIEPKKLYMIAAIVYGAFLLLWALPYLFTAVLDGVKLLGNKKIRASVTIRRKIDKRYRKNLKKLCPRNRTPLWAELAVKTAIYGVLFVVKDVLLHPHIAALAYDMGNAKWWTSFGNEMLNVSHDQQRSPLLWYTTVTLCLAAAWLVSLYRTALRHLKEHRERNSRVENLIIAVFDSANGNIDRAKGVRSLSLREDFLTYKGVADLLCGERSVDLDVRIYLMDFYLTSIETQFPDGLEKDSILLDLRPAWEQLVAENK